MLLLLLKVVMMKTYEKLIFITKRISLFKLCCCSSRVIKPYYNSLRGQTMLLFTVWSNCVIVHNHFLKKKSIFNKIPIKSYKTPNIKEASVNSTSILQTSSTKVRIEIFLPEDNFQLSNSRFPIQTWRFRLLVTYSIISFRVNN